MRAIAEIAILDIVLVHAGALDRVLDGMPGQRHRRGDVESATAGLRQAGARVGNDYGFTHCFLPLRRQSLWRVVARSYTFFGTRNRDTRGLGTANAASGTGDGVMFRRSEFGMLERYLRSTHLGDEKNRSNSV